MKLADFLYENSMTPGLLQMRLGVSNRSTVWRWLTGERTPKPAMLGRIERLTGGAVTREDFLDPRPPRCSQVIIDEHGVERTVLPWSPLWVDPRRPDVPTSGRLSQPVLDAIRALNGRARFTPRGRFLLDGRAVDIKTVMRAANDALRRSGRPLIPYPGVHPIPEGGQ